jgi:hypothetical protein
LCYTPKKLLEFWQDVGLSQESVLDSP